MLTSDFLDNLQQFSGLCPDSWTTTAAEIPERCGTNSWQQNAVQAFRLSIQSSYWALMLIVSKLLLLLLLILLLWLEGLRLTIFGGPWERFRHLLIRNDIHVQAAPSANALSNWNSFQPSLYVSIQHINRHSLLEILLYTCLCR